MSLASVLGLRNWGLWPTELGSVAMSEMAQPPKWGCLRLRVLSSVQGCGPGPASSPSDYVGWAPTSWELGHRPSSRGCHGAQTAMRTSDQVISWAPCPRPSLTESVTCRPHPPPHLELPGSGSVPGTQQVLSNGCYRLCRSGLLTPFSLCRMRILDRALVYVVTRQGFHLASQS